MDNEIITNTCECGTIFERPKSYEEYNTKYPNVHWRWKLKYCDSCFKNKSMNAFEKLPEIISLISQKPTKDEHNNKNG